MATARCAPTRPKTHFQGLAFSLQDLEAVKRAMRDVNGDGLLRPDEADRRRQQLLNRFYGVSGDAKAQPAAAHINDLLEKGGAPQWASKSPTIRS